MDRIQATLKLSIEKLGLSVLSVEHVDRLVIQKSIYLLGLLLGYHWYKYEWTVRGPYSNDLDRELSRIKEAIAKGTDHSFTWFLDDDFISSLDIVRGLVNTTDLPDTANHLMLLCDIAFLIKTNQVSSSDPDGIVVILRRWGRYYADSEVWEGLELLQNKQFV